MAEVKIKASHMIKPAEKTWSTGTMKLTELDMTFGRVFVPSVLLYGPNKDFDSVLISRTLKESLGKALTHFYPFAGRLKPTEGGRMELVLDDTADTWGVPLVEAETAMEVAEFGDLAEAEATGKFQHLIPKVDFMGKPLQELPLFAVQITHFRCGGVAVAFSMSHAVCDGLGAGHFLAEWTRFARGEPLEMAPIHDRSLLSGGVPSSRSADVDPPMMSQSEAAPPSPPPMLPPPTANINGPPQIVALKLPITKTQINNLKKTASDAMGGGRPYSRFEALAALVWRCARKARGEEENQKLDAISFAVDIRRRLNPPLPFVFNGNSVIMATTTCELEDLISNPLGDACGKIRETIAKVTDKYVGEYLEYQKSREDLGVPEKPKNSEGPVVIPTVIMISWLNLKLTNLDFGWGNELHIANSPPAIEGVACLLNGKEEGSVIVVMCLQVAHVDKFKEYFSVELN